MNEKVRLVTTDGCEACRIMRNIILDVINTEEFAKIDFEEMPINEHNSGFAKQNNITDFPTVCFMQDGKVIDKLVGTTNHNNLKNKIKGVYSL